MSDLELIEITERDRIYRRIAELDAAWGNITLALEQCEQGQTIEQVLANYRAVRRTCVAIAEADRAALGNKLQVIDPSPSQPRRQ